MDELTRKQGIFVKEYLDTGNGTQSALKAYDTDSENIAGAIAWENLRKPKIMQAIQDSAEIAQSIVLQLAMTAENENVKLNASKDILDRAGFKPIEKSEVKNTVNLASIEERAMIDKAFNNI